MICRLARLAGLILLIPATSPKAAEPVRVLTAVTLKPVLDMVAEYYRRNDGDAPFAVVFATDAATDPGFEIADAFPDDTHPPILYPVAVTSESRNPDARRFITYLRSPEALARLKERDYVVLVQSK